jgi:hypothetical protein
MSDTPAAGVSAPAVRQGDLFTDLGPAVASGDLVVMGGRAQRDWRHSVPKQATPAGPRISINFAPALP